MRRIAIGVACLCAVLIAVPPATAGVVGTWTQVTDGTGRNIDQVGVARTSDGVLHVFWRKRIGALQESIQHTPIKTDGTVGTANAASETVASVGNPDVVVLPDGGLRIFFAGLTGSASALDGVLSASAGADGLTWGPTARVSSTTSAIPEGVGAAVRPDGVPVFSYAYSFVLGLHAGLDPAVADTDLLPDNRCCAYLPDVTFSSTGEGYLGWYQNVDGEAGLFVQQIAPTVGTKQLVPGSVGADGKGLTLDERMPMVTRKGSPGVFVAYCTGYPTCTTVVLWKIGAPAPITVASGVDIEDVNIAAAPDGRIWVMWQDTDTGKIYASRSNADVTVMGGAAELAPAPGTTTVWKLMGDATNESLDVLASMTTGTSIGTWHTKLLPGLAVEMKRSKRTVTVTVSDAGQPVRGAKVSLGRSTVTTDRRGKASGKVKGDELEVSKAGFTTARVSLTDD